MGLELLRHEGSRLVICHPGSNRRHERFFKGLRRSTQDFANFHEQAVLIQFILNGQAFFGQFVGHFQNDGIRHQRVFSVRRRFT